MRKKGYKVIKKNKLTLRYYGNIDGLNICYHLKLVFQKPPLKILFYKNIATNEDYINIYCFPNQTKFTDKCIMWYLYNRARNVREYEELSFKYFR